MWVLQPNPKPKTIKLKLKGTDLEKTQKTENKGEVLESRTKMDYQKHEEYKGLKAKNSGKTCKKTMNSTYNQGISKK